MNDVVFVMANSKLMKQKDVRNTKNYNIDELASDEEWTVEDNEANDVELLDEVGEANLWMIWRFLQLLRMMKVIA